jgi:hypothetical protein
MYNTEFRYLLVQEENEGQVIDSHLFMTIFITIFIVFVCINIFLALYYLVIYSAIFVNHIMTQIWSYLTPGNELIELLFMITVIGCSIGIIVAFKYITDIFDEKFTKMKKDKDILEEKEIEEIRNLLVKIWLLHYNVITKESEAQGEETEGEGEETEGEGEEAEGEK